VSESSNERSAVVAGTYYLRQQAKHEEKLKDIQEQVAEGKLVIRKMTAAERKRFPPRDGARGRQSTKRA
jgi:hypothetical protein